MAIFSCVKPHAHDTLPRRQKSLKRQPLVDIGANNAQLRGSASLDLTRFGGTGQGQPDGASPMARAMSRRNGAKLQKGRRVTKSMIGVPTDFEHVSHTDKAAALGSKEMVEVNNALRIIHEPEQPPVKETSIPVLHIRQSNDGLKENLIPLSDSPDSSRQSIDDLPKKPTAVVVNKRKAPPPITPSIIKAAGLPPSLGTNARLNTSPTKNGLLAPSYGARTSPPKNRVQRTSNDFAGVNDGRHGIAPGASFERKGGLGDLFTPMDGLPGSSGIPDYAAVNSLSPRNQGPPRSTTLQDLALSESMENVAKHALGQSTTSTTSHSNTPAVGMPAQVRMSPSGPLDYMTDSTKIKWNNGMEQIAKQLREGA